MKRRALVARTKEADYVLVRHSAKHDWYRNRATGVSQPVPRHGEIKDRLAKHTLAKLDCR